MMTRLKSTFTFCVCSLVSALCAVLMMCQIASARDTLPPQPDPQLVQQACVRVVAMDDVSWSVWLVSSVDARQQGLMGVTQLSSQQGMLFDFEAPRVVRMWMKNTFIALDMVFLSEDLTVLGVHRDARPHDEQIIASPAGTRYVLELSAGQSVHLHPDLRMSIQGQPVGACAALQYSAAD